MDALHELIHSLTPNEKGYFKKNAGGSANYIKLFDAMDAQHSYDEAAIKKKFKGEKFIIQFSVAKNYLYEAILKALSAYSAEQYVEQKVFAIFSQTQILIDKGLYAQAFKLLNKGIDICETNELIGLRFQLHLLERKLYLLQATDKEAAMPVVDLIRTSDYITRAITDYTQLLALHYQQMAIAYESSTIKGEQQKKTHEAIFKQAQQVVPTTRMAAMLQADVRINYYSSKADYEKSYHEIADALSKIKTHPYYNNHEQISTVILYDLALTDALRSGKLKEFEKHLSDFKKLELSSEPVKISATLSYARFALVYFDMKAERKKLMVLTDETQKQVKTYGAKIRKDLHLGVIIAFCSAMLEYGEYQRALDWIALYREYPKLDRHYDFQAFILIFQLIAHYELGNAVFVNNILENLRYFLKKNKQQTPFEEIILLSFKHLSQITDKEKLQKKLEKHLSELRSYADHFPGAANNVVLPIFAAFLQSKTSGKKYHEFLGK